MRRLIASLAAVIILAGCSSTIAEDASGEQIYDALCSRCHADDLSGRVGPALGPGSAAEQQPDSYLMQAITFGQGRMPSFRASLSEEQVERVVAFLRAGPGG